MDFVDGITKRPVVLAWVIVRYFEHNALILTWHKNVNRILLHGVKWINACIQILCYFSIDRPLILKVTVNKLQH